MGGRRWSRTGGSRELARVAIVGLALAMLFTTLRPRPPWSAAEIATLRALWIGSLAPRPRDDSNAVADDPAAAEFGRKLFFDSRFSANGYVSCATCHRPDRGFQDGLARGRGVRLSRRRTPSLVGVAYNPVLLWDGRKDSLWSQALGPLESATEHGGHRFRCARTIAYHYGADYEPIFGALPAVDWTARWTDLAPIDQAAVTRVFVNMGKAIAAYERTLRPPPTRFDVYVEAVLTQRPTRGTILTSEEVAGLKLFIGKADCLRCHNTPLFTDHQPHNTGVPPSNAAQPDAGWADGLRLRLPDEFGRCGPWSDGEPASSDCAHRGRPGEVPVRYLGAFKTPSLRLVATRPPYMHAGQFATLEEVLKHYSTAPAAALGASEIQPQHFTVIERRQLLAFLHALSG